ncbi:heme biosynthesis protein HemY [Pasteurella bettyae]|uniref:HemY protein n=1 Tax=Pasteurella bettyae CCUG 2042 TaxID=1095749 RepID=I3D8N8_9PAST|nr:heme biosynthesis protein HemY [Pasteurella bettyae]EIJ68081.1 hemY protein [Pasteurella bettyae CCUG 2042]SUB22590.1 protein hemY [Pasteurella bettyae]
MFKVLFLMLALLAGLIAGPYLSGKQGYVLIATNSHNIEMSITTLIIFFVMAMAIVYLLEWLVSLFFKWSNNSYNFFSKRKRIKAQQQTLEGLMRMNEGDYSKAEKLIGKNAKHSAEPILNFIKAAEAAQQRGDEFSANRYLIEATELAGSDNLLVELARTRILLQQNKLPAARSAVDSVLEMAPRNPEVLKLATEIYSRSKAFAALDNILNNLENSGLYSQQEFIKLQHQVEDGLLDEIMNEDGADGLLAWWNDQSRKRRNNFYAKLGLIKRLIDCNDHDSAYELTLDAVKKIDDNRDLSGELFNVITRLQATDSSKLMKLLEKRASSTSSENLCALNRALGYLYVRNDNFLKATEAFKKVITCSEKLDPNDATMAAYVFEQVQDFDAAKSVRETSLKTAMAVDNLKTEEIVVEPPAFLPESVENKPQETVKTAQWVSK